MQKVTLKTDLSPHDARHRLGAAIDHPLAIWGARPVLGHVRASTAGLYQRRRLHNPFQTRLGLVLEPEDDRYHGGLILHGASDIGPFARIMLVLMTVMLMAIVLIVREQQGADSALPWGVAVIGALAIGLIYALGRAVASGEHDFLVRFLIETLDARIIETPRDA